MKLMEIYGGRYNRFGGSLGNPARREFKRQEMEHELRHEDEAMRRESGSRYPSRYPASRPAPAAPQSNEVFVISIAGRIWKKDGQPVTFTGEARARGAAEKIKQRMAERGQSGDVEVLPTK